MKYEKTEFIINETTNINNETLSQLIKYPIKIINIIQKNNMALLPI